MTWFEEFGSATRGWCAFLKQSEQIFDYSSIILSTSEPTPTTATATTTAEPTQPAATSTLPEGDEGDVGSSFADRRLEVDDDGRLERQNNLGQLNMFCDLEITVKNSAIREDCIAQRWHYCFSPRSPGFDSQHSQKFLSFIFYLLSCA